MFYLKRRAPGSFQPQGQARPRHPRHGCGSGTRAASREHALHPCYSEEQDPFGMRETGTRQCPQPWPNHRAQTGELLQAPAASVTSLTALRVAGDFSRALGTACSRSWSRAALQGLRGPDPSETGEAPRAHRPPSPAQPCPARSPGRDRRGQRWLLGSPTVSAGITPGVKAGQEFCFPEGRGLATEPAPAEAGPSPGVIPPPSTAATCPSPRGLTRG